MRQMSIMFVRLVQWLRISFFNLLLVACIGVILRYKIAYSLPFIDQKYLLHAHSHFAFSGWITQALMALMVAYLSKYLKTDLFPKYKWLLYANLLTAYGMLFSFPFQGYGAISITFSTLSIFTSWAFAVAYWKDLNRLSSNNIVNHWFKAALIFNVISSLGAFSLAFMMANKIIHQNWYLLAIYFFLHFQYNGWFFFACIGLLLEKVLAFTPSLKNQKEVFWIFAASCIPAYFLSALWIPMPAWVYFIIVLSALAQLYGWLILVKNIFKQEQLFTSGLPIHAKWLLSLSAIALTIKLLLQAISTIPSLSTLAFGFRPIIIAYLHLILLGMISLFIIGYFLSEKSITINKRLHAGIIIFTSGILINEILLMVQGISAISNFSVPLINELLLVAAAILFSGMLFLNLGLKKSN